MESDLHKKLRAENVALIGVITIIIVLAGYGFYRYRTLDSEFNLAKEKNLELATELEEVKAERLNLFELSSYQESLINSFQEQISSLGNTVGTLEKLTQIDKELLRKYSKVYFLSENYRPAKLVAMDKSFLYNKENDAYIHAQVLPHLEMMFKFTSSNNIDLLIASAFRSFEEQSSLKSQYTVVYGAGTANQFSADQGYSEHQLGTTVDFTTSQIGGTFPEFQATPAYKWLTDNAHKYGLILSYPESNAYYKFEPWHWRFVGVELAKRLYVDREHFYDLGQREIDEYLIKLFD